MDNKISNPKKDLEENTSMNEKDYLTTILGIEKALVKDYAVTLTEASNDDLYNDFFDMFNDISETQRDIYNFMFKNGWYELEQATEEKINEKLTNFEENITQLEDNS